jgi:hypothetical protein
MLQIRLSGGIVAATLFSLAFGLAASVREASAQIPSAQGTFYACVKVDKDEDEARLVRLVAEDEPCSKHETRVQWSAVGPQGPQGPQGATGASGIQGSQGVVGPTGPQGAIGATGATGSTGATGATGATGVSVTVDNVGVDSPGCFGVGGVKLTLIDGQGATVGDPQFVCNGAAGATGAVGPTGPSGTTGQAVVAALSSVAVSVSSPSTCVISASLMVTASAANDVVLVADGAVMTTSGVTSGFSIVDVFLLVDGTTTVGIRRVYASNNTGAIQQIASWSMSRRLSLSAGQHTVVVCGLLAGGSTATFGGDAGSGRQTSLIATVLNK